MMMNLLVNDSNDDYNTEESNVEFNFRFIMLRLSIYEIEIKFNIHIVFAKDIYLLCA
jgi:hypothetical protein